MKIPKVGIGSSIPVTSYKYGKDYTLIDNQIRFIFNETLSKNKGMKIFPIIINTARSPHEVDISVNLGADNIQNGKPIHRELKLIVTNDKSQLSHDLDLFIADNFRS